MENRDKQDETGADSERIDSEHIAWCWSMFQALAIGGMWAVPRSGLIFVKQSAIPPILVLKDRMPYDPAMPGSASELVEYQDADYEVIRRHFAAAHILVRKKSDH